MGAGDWVGRWGGGESFGEFEEGCDEASAESFGAREVEAGFVLVERLVPVRAVPAVGERKVFQPVNVLVVIVDKTGLQRAEPVVELPAIGKRAQGEARQLRKRVVRDWLAAVEEEGDAEAREDAAQRGVMVIKGAEDDGAVAEASACADVAEDFASGEDGFGFGVGAEGEAGGGRLEAGWAAGG